MTEIVRATGNMIAGDSAQSQEGEKESKQHYDIFRVERNFESLPVWSLVPNKNTVFTDSKTIELEPERLPDGNLVQRKIIITPSAKYGYPTIKTQEHWCAFQKLWHDSPTKETGKVEYSRRQLLEGILGKAGCGNSSKALDLSVLQLASTLYQFEYTFFDKEQEKSRREVKGFIPITHFHLTECRTKNEVTHDKCSVTLNPLIVSNLLRGYFKPLLLPIASQFEGIANYLYRKLDTQFSHYTKYEISTARFFRENGLEGSEYKYPSSRKRLLEKAIKKLIGKPTSSGAVIAKYEFAKTANGKDWKLIVRSKRKHNRTVQAEVSEALQSVEPESKKRKPKQKATEKPQEPQHKAKEPQAKEIPTPNPKKPLEARSEALEVLTYFDEVFGLGGDGDKQYSKNAVTKASAFIKRDGLEKTKFLIDFARREAPKTNYEPKTFNGITHYRSDALKAWKANARLQKRQEREAQKVAEKLREDARLDHEKIYRDDYHEYVDELVCSLGDEYPERFNEFRLWQGEQRREKENLDGNLREVSLRVFDSEGQIILRLTQFFKDNPDIHIPDFWEWDGTHNPNSFGKKPDMGGSS